MADREERKRIRKKRIDQRNANETASVSEISEVQQGGVKTGLQQVSESIFNLDNRKHSGLQDVTAVRVAIDELESKRRIEDEQLRRDRLGKLQHEALSSAKANAAIEMKWAELLEKEIPQELYADIQLQIAGCNKIIKSKDDLINEFQRQLRGKDEEYVRTLRQQAEDVEELLKRIRNEFVELQTAYENEFRAIEEAYLEERERIIGDHTSEIEAMFDLRKNKEVNYKETKQKREEHYQKEIDDLITKGADQYNKLKIELELNIQTLKQQLEEIRATYQLNTEKLDYNYRVLTELDVEKNAELTRYKRRLNKLKDQLNQLITKFNEMESADSKLNNELTEDYRSLTQKYKDLQAKFRHFEVSDTGKYDEVWAMHEEEVKDLLDQLLKADKIITEQQLGWAWKPPDLPSLQKVLGRHGSMGMTGALTAEEGGGNGGSNGEGHNNNNLHPSATTPSTSHAKTSKKISGARVRAVLRLLAMEAGFLLNPEVQESLSALSAEEGDLQRAEAMLRALGIKSEEKLQTLVSYFYKDTSPEVSYWGGAAPPPPSATTTSGKASAKGGTKEPLETPNGLDDNGEYDGELQEEEMMLHHLPEDLHELKTLMSPEHVIQAVKAYLEDVSVDGGGTGSGAAGAAATGGAKGVEDDLRIEQKRLQAMRNYWNQLAQVVSDDSVSVWKQLDVDYGTLRELMNKRSSAIAEVDALNSRNADLKRLLNQYLGDAVTNASLQVPPAQVMRVRNVSPPPKGKNPSKSSKLDPAAGQATSSQSGNKKKNVLFSQTR